MAAHDEFKTITSQYKTDFGNGVVIRADDYVHTGKWVFDCGRSRLISRKPLPVPIMELRKTHTFKIGNMYYLEKSEQTLGRKAIQAVIAMPEWYENLDYLYSVLSENSNLNSHLFDLLAEHDGRTWVLIVWQEIVPDGQSKFEIIAESYNPDIYVDHANALQAAIQSCPAKQ